EFRKLLVPRRNNALDLELLADEFEASDLKVEYLGKVDFQTLALDMVQAFYDAAARDPRLQEPLKIDLLRQMAADVAEMADLLKRQADASDESLDELKKIRLISNDVAQGNERGDILLEAIKNILEETRQGVYTEPAAYRTIMDALGRSGLEDDQETTSEVAEIHGLLETMRNRLISLGKAPGPDDLADMEDNYRQSIIDRFSTLTFKGITPSGKAIALPLDKLYVELKAVADAPEAADAYSAEERRMLLKAEGRGGKERHEMSLHLDSLRLERWKKEARTRDTRLERRSITETIQDPTHRGVVILGDPGSGKTTLLHHLAMSLAAEENSKSALPIFVPLAAYDDYLSRVGNDAPLGEFVALYHEKWQNMPGLAPLFQRALDQGRAVLLLDGLDEVLETVTRQFVAGQTEALIRQWTGKGNRCVVTSRVVGYREAPLPQSLLHVTVLDFGQPEIEIFVHQWSLAYETWVQGRETPTAVQHAKFEEEAFLEDVRSNPSVERLAANPLLLTMLALLRRQVGKLP
ncbi:MAG: NACHT domain-containing protein, partial [Desulfobacterales bacterium]|nr:NACHT domain-containing protein [Desulfobacterales bacterium]